MDKIFTCLLAATLLCSSVGFADEEAKSEEVEVKQEDSKSVSISVTANSESSSSTDDGESKTSFSGKIVVIGSDGEKKEFDLGDKLPEGFQWLDLGGNHDSLMFQKHENKERFMIGVMCEPVAELYRNHLNLDGHGLVVTQVSEDMPAAKAGVATNDILLTLNDTRLETLKNLVDVVEASDGNELKLTMLTDGEPRELTITPAKSTSGAALKGLPDGWKSIVGGIERRETKGPDIAANSVILRRVGPGIRIRNNGKPVIRKLLDKTTEPAEKPRLQDLQEQIQSLRKQLTDLREQLKSLKQN